MGQPDNHLQGDPCESRKALHGTSEELVWLDAIFHRERTSAEVRILAAYNCTDEENDANIQVLRRRAWTALHGKIMEQLSDHAIMAKLRDQFEDSFRYDASGVPRVWTPNDDIDGEFRRAKEEVSLQSRFGTMEMLC